MNAEDFATDVMRRWQQKTWVPMLGLSPEDTEDCIMAAITECLSLPELYSKRPTEMFERALRRIANSMREETGYSCYEDEL